MSRAFLLSVAFVLLAWAGAAHAHADDAVGPGDIWHHWTFDPLVLVPMLIAQFFYMRGWMRLPERRRSKKLGACFLAGQAVLFAALISPIDALGETLLTFHMVQHMLLVAVAPPLLLMGRPGMVFSAALPKRFLAGAARIPVARPLLLGIVWLTGLIPATILHGLALWLWHAPPAFEAALVNDFIHTLEHLSFFGTALLFWLALLRAGVTTRTALAGALASFVTFFHSGMLGGILSLAPVPLYPAYGHRPALWGLDLLEDQQLAGLIMWVPIGPVYLAATLWMVSKLLKTETAAA